MPERQRANRVAVRAVVWQIIATAILIGAVVVLQRQQAAGQQAARVEQTDQLRLGCRRSTARDFEALGTNRDLAGLARDAARARRTTGDLEIAARYDRRAADAEARVATITARVPSSSDPSAVRRFCTDLFPVPSP